MKVCSQPGCPTLVASGRCAEHRREREQQRGTTAARGYGAKHRALRAKWAPRVAAGQVRCWRCGQPISPLEPWDLGHDDRDRGRYRGPEHVACNRATAGRRTTPEGPPSPQPRETAEEGKRAVYGSPASQGHPVTDRPRRAT